MNGQWPKQRSVISLQLMIQLGLDLGLDLDTCLHGTGINPAQLATLQGDIDATSELQLLANLIRALPDQHELGLLAGRRYRLTTYGAWGYALLSSATARQAAELGLRYLGLTYAFTHISLIEGQAQAALQFDDTGLEPPLQSFIVQRDMLGAQVAMREMLGTRLPLQRVLLRQVAPADPSAFIEAFGRLPEFGATSNRLYFDAGLLDAPLPLANPMLVEVCEQQCRTILARHRWHDGLCGQVRQLLLQSPRQMPDMERIAGHLHISSRTLRRRLIEEGSSFRALQDEVRQALAEDLLAAGALTLEEIAERLGYGELSNFIHAFRRWKGTTPARYVRDRAL